MALGLSGSNGGIAESYRVFAIADVEAGLTKYRRLCDSAPREVKPLYETILRNLQSLSDRMSKSPLEDKVGST